jgi:O-antigen ligase
MSSASVLPWIEARPERVRIGHVLLMAILLVPISLTVADDGVSANYLFALLLVVAPRGYRQNYQASAYIAFMILSLAIGIVLFSHLDAIFLMRQFISFSLMLFGVLLLFVRLSTRLEEFLTATVLCAVAYSLTAFYMFTYGGFSIVDVYMVKGGMRDFITDWPQRYVVVLIFAFFVGLHRWKRGLIWVVADVVILACIFITFTRAAWLGVAGGFIAYIVMLLAGRRRSGGGSSARQKLVIVASVAVATAALFYAAVNPDVAQAFGTIYDDLSDVSQTDPHNFGANESEGERLDLYSQIIKTVEDNPFTGTGFAGAYLVIAGEGSAHGQYFDVLLRTGVIGLIIYLLFWGKLMRYYLRADIGVVAGLIALSVFGLFHETTKLSYGALIFFFLLNKAYAAEAPSGTTLRAGTVPA